MYRRVSALDSDETCAADGGCVGPFQVGEVFPGQHGAATHARGTQRLRVLRLRTVTAVQMSFPRINPGARVGLVVVMPSARRSGVHQRIRGTRQLIISVWRSA